MSENNGLSARSYLDSAKRAARELATNGKLVTIEDVRAKVGAPPEHVNPTLMGQVFRGKGWVKVGTINASREGRRSSKISQFAFNDAA
jgi:hypothetical protein